MIHRIFIIAGVLLLAAGAFLFHRRHYFCLRAVHGRCSHEKIAGRLIKKVGKELDLKNEQKTMLRDISSELIKKHEALREERDPLFSDLIREIEKDKPDKDALNRLFDEKMALVSEMHALAVDRLLDFHATLTPDQKKKLTILIQKHHDRMNH